MRTTETGGIKIIYNGVSTNGKCISTELDKKIGMGAFTSSIPKTDERSLGYTFLYDGTEIESNIKIQIDEWYQNNMTSYTSYLEDTVWCNDRSKLREEYYFYGPYTRLANDTDPIVVTEPPGSDRYKGIPSFNCSRTEDKYTVSTANGNGKLKYPVALITADELSFAGATWLQVNNSFYLHSDNYFWTLSPSAYYDYRWGSCFGGTWGSGGCHAGVCTSIYPPCIDAIADVRPAVSLKSGTTFSSGDGTPDNPYVVS